MKFLKALKPQRLGNFGEIGGSEIRTSINYGPNEVLITVALS